MITILKKIIAIPQKVLTEFFIILAGIFLSCMMNLPPSIVTNKIKRCLLIWQGAKIGKNPCIFTGVWVLGPRGLTVGDNVALGHNVKITAMGRVTIEDNVLIGHGATIISANHRIPPNKGLIRFSGHEYKPVLIKKDAWICANTTVLPGVTVGEGAVVAAGAVVTKDVEPFSVVGGVPAKLIRHRNQKITNC